MDILQFYQSLPKVQETLHTKFIYVTHSYEEAV